MLDRSLAFRLKTRTVGCLRGRDSSQIELVQWGARASFFLRSRSFLSNTSKDVRIYEVRPRKDRRGVDLISDALPVGWLWYGEPDTVSNAIDYAKFFSRSHDAVIRVYDEAGNVIETHEHKGDFKEW